MTTTARTHDLFEHERRFWNAMRDKDGEAASQMTHDHCIVVGAQGVSAVDPNTMARLTREGDWELDRYTFDESTAQVQFLNDDIALVAYKVKEKLTVEGKPVNLGLTTPRCGFARTASGCARCIRSRWPEIPLAVTGHGPPENTPPETGAGCCRKKSVDGRLIHLPSAIGSFTPVTARPAPSGRTHPACAPPCRC
jgi:hypothetical protein